MRRHGFDPDPIPLSAKDVVEKALIALDEGKLQLSVDDEHCPHSARNV